MSKFSKFFGGGKDKSAQRAAEESRRREAQRQARLAEGRTAIDSAFGAFDDPYYQSRATSYNEFALPQLNEQFADQKKALIHALSRSGNLNSTTAAQKNRDLKTTYERNKQLLESKGNDYATGARRDVADSRSRLLSMLSSTEDPTTVANEAVRESALLREAPSFDPLGSMFADFASDLDKVNTARTIGTAFKGGSGSSLYQDRGGSASGRIVR